MKSILETPPSTKQNLCYLLPHSLTQEAANPPSLVITALFQRLFTQPTLLFFITCMAQTMSCCKGEEKLTSEEQLKLKSGS